MFKSCWWLVVFVLGDVVVTLLLFYLIFRARDEGAADMVDFMSAPPAAKPRRRRWKNPNDRLRP